MTVPDYRVERNPVVLANAAAVRLRSGLYTVPWYASLGWGAVLILAYPVAVFAPLVILALLQQPDDDRPAIMRVALDCALVGYTILALQFVLSGRFRWIEGPFGLDRITRFHRVMGMIAFVLLIAHPLLLTHNLGWFLLTRLRVRWPIWLGRTAAALLLVHVLLAFLRRVIPFRYVHWQRIHACIALSILVAGVGHGIAIGDDLATPGARMMWIIAGSIGLAAWTWNRIIRPRILRTAVMGRLFTVLSVTQETPTVCTVTLVRLARNNARVFRHLPGQFQFVRFRRNGHWTEEHPFTIASAPAANDQIALTVKNVGDFTATIASLKKGDLATIHGPFGRFSYTLHPHERDLVFIAGGVGITPFISMLRHMNRTCDTRRVLLLYASRREQDILFYEELARIERSRFPDLKVIHLLSEPHAGWRGPSGRLDATRILEYVGDLNSKVFYFCCPPMMTAALRRGLKKEGVKSAAMRTDFFAL